jgi:hypothetical protein
MTEDGVNISVFTTKTSDNTGSLDVAPRFRYIIRVAAISLEDFVAASAKTFFSLGFLTMPFSVENGVVSSVVVMSLNSRLMRISNGQIPLVCDGDKGEGDGRRNAWTTQHYRHHRSPVMRPKSPPPTEPGPIHCSS